MDLKNDTAWCRIFTLADSQSPSERVDGINKAHVAFQNTLSRAKNKYYIDRKADIPETLRILRNQGIISEEIRENAYLANQTRNLLAHQGTIPPRSESVNAVKSLYTAYLNIEYIIVSGGTPVEEPVENAEIYFQISKSRLISGQIEDGFACLGEAIKHAPQYIDIAQQDDVFKLHNARLSRFLSSLYVKTAVDISQATKPLADKYASIHQNYAEIRMLSPIVEIWQKIAASEIELIDLCLYNKNDFKRDYKTVESTMEEVPVRHARQYEEQEKWVAATRKSIDDCRSIWSLENVIMEMEKFNTEKEKIYRDEVFYKWIDIFRQMKDYATHRRSKASDLEALDIVNRERDERERRSRENTQKTLQAAGTGSLGCLVILISAIPGVIVGAIAGFLINVGGCVMGMSLQTGDRVIIASMIICGIISGLIGLASAK